MKLLGGVIFNAIIAVDVLMNFITHLELRQCKNDLMKSKCMLVWKLPRFFPHFIGE